MKCSINIRYIKGIFFLIAFHAIICFDALAQPADKLATNETLNLYYNLYKLINKGVMFGHQDDLAYGVNWKYENNRSDVKDLVGEWPAIVGWDLSKIEFGSPNNIDSVPSSTMKSLIKKGYSYGIINTISWHANNPLTNGNAWDTTLGTVSAVLPGGEKHEFFKSWLDKIAAFVSELKGSNGELIPVLFRPYHELTGSWFWWGKKRCTAQEFISLWRFTVTYLKEVKGLHNILYAYSTSNFDSEKDFLERYPGDDFVDIIGFDLYQRGDPKDKNVFITRLNNQLTILSNVAAKLHKLPALTETGYNTIPDATWWTNTLWNNLEKYKLSYVLVWRNAGDLKNGNMHYFVPYKNDVSAKNFIKFYRKKKTLFGTQISKEKVYTPVTSY